MYTVPLLLPGDMDKTFTPFPYVYDYFLPSYLYTPCGVVAFCVRPSLIWDSCTCSTACAFPT